MSTLVHMLQGSVERFPEAEAVVHKQSRVTYKELWSQVMKVAHFLKSQGLKREDRVGLLIENCPEYIAVYYGVLAAGGTVVALNSQLKARTLVNTLKHSEARWLFAAGNHEELPRIAERFEGGLRIATIGPVRGKEMGESHTFEDIMAKEDSPMTMDQVDDPSKLAALIYTSGTTGNPKGVMLSHSNLKTNVDSIIAYLKLTEKDSIVNVLPFYYSYGNSILHTHLAVGAKLVLENSMVYLAKVLERMAKERVSGFSGVPSTFALILARTKLSDYDLSAVRYMTQAGGPMPPANVERFTRELPHVRFFVMYGQTEASARLSYLPAEKLTEKLGSCGIPIPGVKLEIRNSDFKELPPGETGEICAYGGNIMMGYWKDPENTAKVIRDGWLLTGDLAHKDEDGYIFIDGRASDMIKSGAHRISPQEIEEVIAEIDAVAEVGVTGMDDDVLGQVIKAVVVLKSDYDLDGMAIQKYCSENLAQYKIPKTVEIVTEMPKTASGKIQRHML